MRILITGGLGFIGGRLAQYLSKLDYKVVIASRKTGNLYNLLPNVEIVKVEWNDLYSLENLCSGIDVVIHAAGMNAQDCANNPTQALLFNGVATSRLVDAAVKAKVERFIYLSTAHVYSSPLSGTLAEETCPRNLHPYATSHLAGEHCVLYAHQLGQLSCNILRLSNTFGTPIHKDVNCWMLLVNDLCRQAVTSHELILKTFGQQKRNFVSISEVCKVISYLLGLHDIDYDVSILNVGGVVTKTVWEMACLIRERCEYKLKLPIKIKRTSLRKKENVKYMLDYKLERLYKIGYQAESDYVAELDNLIDHCLLWFA